ncbi:MAG TPA: Gfo/Idh/MocA family oxidoreductase, partial [Spirochaetia bacterium]|nr:Gfo/Idh/MocA family oxidoreductase [Spirochaetia bacterium]
MKQINVGLIGHKFMGRAHTHAYTDLPLFFDTGIDVVKHTICADEDGVKAVAARWGWENWSTDWHELVESPEIDLIDIAAPSAIHSEVAIAACKAGKHVFCEKPLALRLEDAREMERAAREAGVVNMIGFNYRKVPALALAKKLIEAGELGELFHFRGVYQQGWLVDPGYPLVWRLRKKAAGYGSHGDLGAHVVDIARFLVGEIASVCCLQRTFVKRRPKPSFEDGLTAIAGNDMGDVDVDDASAFLAQFEGRQTMGYFEMTRYGTGHRNQNFIEINGSKGSLQFDMEKMNELEVYLTSDPAHLQGFRRVQVGEGEHPYLKAWWPAGHIIGYADTFVNQAFDLVCAIRDKSVASPDFADGVACQEVLEA